MKELLPIVLILLISTAQAIDTNAPWHPINQVSVDDSGTASVDADGDGIVDNSESSSSLSCTGCITSTQIESGVITGNELASGSVQSVHVLDGTLVSDDIDPSSIQTRVSSCSIGSSIRVINEDGSVTCQSSSTASFWNNTGSILHPADTSWDVGIGTTGPDTALHVTGGACIDTDGVCSDPGAGSLDAVGTIDAGEFTEDGSSTLSNDISGTAAVASSLGTGVIATPTSLTSSNNLDSLSDGWYRWTSSLPTNAPSSYMVMVQQSDPSQKIQMAFGSAGSGEIYVRRADSGTFYDWARMWNEDNDGSGSGLAADTVDGYHLNQDVRTTASPSFTSRLTIDGVSPQVFLDDTSGTDDFWIHVNGNNFYVLADRGSDGAWESPHPLQLEADTSNAYVFGNIMWHSGNDGTGSGLNADYLDGQSGAYYLDNSNAATLCANNYILNGDGTCDLISSLSVSYATSAGTATTANDLSCTNCIGTTEIADSYLLNTGDTASGNYNFDSGTLYVDASANEVGIGTTSPGATLDVNGNLYVKGTLYDSDDTDINIGESLSVSGGIWANGGINSQGNIDGDGIHLRADGGVSDGVNLWKMYAYGNTFLNGGTYQGSDRRWKRNITVIGNALDKIMTIDGVYYSWRAEDYPNMNFDNKTHLGVIAQDVEKVFPEVVVETKGYKTVTYAQLTPALVQAIKELKQEKDNEISQLREENKALKEILCLDHPEAQVCQ